MNKTGWGRMVAALSTAAVMFVIGMYLTVDRESKATAEPQKTTLSLWYYWDAAEGRKSLVHLVDEFNENNSQIEVKLRYVPDEDFKKTLALAIADGTMPDLAIVDSSDVKYYESMGTLTDVSDCMDAEQYLELALSSCRDADGAYTGLPLGLNCLTFYYNERALHEAGVEPPETMEEFVDAARRLTTKTMYGCAFPSLQSEESMFCFLPILWSAGGSLSDIDSPESQRAFEVLKQLSESGAMSRSCMNMTLSDISREFVKENVAMIFGVSGIEHTVSSINPELRYRAAAIPGNGQPISVSGGEVLTITSGRHEAAAKAFVRFMAQPQQIERYLDGLGYLAPRNDLLEAQIQEYPQKKKYLEILKTARVRDFTPYWPSLTIAISDAINRVVTGEEPEAVCQDLQMEILSIQEEWDGD